MNLFQVLEGSDATEVSAKVSDAMREGWRPVGGVCVTAIRGEAADAGNYWNYAQAMAKRVAKPSPRKKRKMR